MSVSWPDLESRRATLLSQFVSLGDLRGGSIPTPWAAAATPTAAVTGLNARLTYKMQGTTVMDSPGDSAAQKKAETEIAEFRRFEQLVREVIEVNALICRALPVKGTLTEHAKKRSMKTAVPSYPEIVLLVFPAARIVAVEVDPGQEFTH